MQSSIGTLEKVLHDRLMRWNAILFQLQRTKSAISLEEEKGRILHRIGLAEEDYKKVANNA